MITTYRINITCKNPRCSGIRVWGFRSNGTVREYDDNYVIVVGCIYCKDSVKVNLTKADQTVVSGTLFAHIKVI